MLVLMLGIVVFLGMHSVTTFREMRTSTIERFGLGPFKSIYSLAALVGFALIVWGFLRYRAEGLITESTPPARPRRLLATVPGISPKRGGHLRRDPGVARREAQRNSLGGRRNRGIRAARTNIVAQGMAMVRRVSRNAIYG